MRSVILAAMAAFALVGCGAPEASPSTDGIDVAKGQSVVPADMFTAAQESALDADLARIAEGTPLEEGIPNPPLQSCGLAADERLCRYEQMKFLADWRSAHAGDYSAQRNVAYCLASRCEGVTPNKMQGCAWRAVIVDSAHPDVTDGDVSNFQTDCGSLSDAAREAATVQAERIAQTIARTPAA